MRNKSSFKLTPPAPLPLSLTVLSEVMYVRLIQVSSEEVSIHFVLEINCYCEVMSCVLTEESMKVALENDERIKEISKDISSELTQNKYDISYFLEKLGFALSSQDVGLRLQGVKLFSSTLCSLPTEHLSEEQLGFIADFYCSRLKDNHKILPATLSGILALLRMRIPKGFVSKVFTNLFQHVSCQSQSREDREKIFLIIKTASELHYNELKYMGVDFVYGVISTIDGERDPRNLKFLFSYMPIFMQQYPLQHLAEEMFEIFACYFPIDFQPSKNESFVSRDSLASMLADCLVGSSAFAEWAVALALEKLDTDLKVAKLDSLDLLARCSKFPAELFTPHFENIWQSMKLIVFPGCDDAEVISAGLKSLTEILINTKNNADIRKSIEVAILSTILTHLSDAHHKMFKPASTIALICVATDALFYGDKILNCLLLDAESAESNADEFIEIFTVISNVLKLYNKQNVVKQIDLKLQERVQQATINCLTNGNLDEECVMKIFECMLEIIEIFTFERRITLYNHLQKCIVNPSSSKFKPFLKAISIQYPAELNDKCISSVLMDFRQYTKDLKKKVLDNVSILIETSYFEPIICRLYKDCIFDSSNPETQKLALQSFQTFLLKELNSTIVAKLNETYKFLEEIISCSRAGIFSADVLSNICSICSLFVRSISKEDQIRIIDQHMGDLNMTVVDLYLANGVLGWANADINIDKHLKTIMYNFTNWLNIDQADLSRQAAHHLLCSLINKAANGLRNDDLLKTFKLNLTDEIDSGNMTAVETLAWMSKALIMRGYSSIEDIIRVIIHLLDQPKVSQSAVTAFHIISTDASEVYLPVVKPLYKQKFFSIVLKEMDKKLKSFSDPHLNAFIYVLQATPHQILKMNLNKVSPILFKCLESESRAPAIISLQVMKTFLSAKDEFFHNHIGHLLKHFIKLSTYKDSMQIRILSLECLETLTKYQSYLLVPYKTDVILGLAPAVDDKKRLVRRVAVTVRNTWFLVGSSDV